MKKLSKPTSQQLYIECLACASSTSPSSHLNPSAAKQSDPFSWRTTLVLRVALVALAAGVLLTGFYTHSFTRMFVTCMFGICGVAGVLLPDWTYFNSDFSKWFSPVDLNDYVLQQSDKSLCRRSQI